MDYHFIEIIIISSLLSILFSILGCIILWKRLTYFCEGLAHVSVLGGVLNSAFPMNLVNYNYIVAFLFFSCNNLLKDRHNKNAITMFITQSFLAISVLVGVFFSDSVRISDYLFGDLFLANSNDLLWLCLMFIIVIPWLIVNFKVILIASINRELAFIYNYRIRLMEISFLIILTVIITISLKIVGAFMTGALLLAPPMIAGNFATSPLKMIYFSVLISTMVSSLSLFLAIYYDVPMSPIVVLVSFILFILIKFLHKPAR